MGAGRSYWYELIFILAAVRATARAAANWDGWDGAFPRPPDLSYNAGAWAKFGRPEKRLRFSRAAEFGRARMAEPGPQGPQRFLR